MKSRLAALLIGLPLCVVLQGCYESPDVTLYEPGVYKGTADPLLDKEKTAQRQQQLVERFNAVQTDR